MNQRRMYQRICTIIVSLFSTIPTLLYDKRLKTDTHTRDIQAGCGSGMTRKQVRYTLREGDGRNLGERSKFSEKS